MSSEYTDEDYENAVTAAVRAGDFGAVESLLIAYAGRNPKRAFALLDTMRLAVRLANR